MKNRINLCLLVASSLLIFSCSKDSEFIEANDKTGLQDQPITQSKTGEDLPISHFDDDKMVVEKLFQIESFKKELENQNDLQFTEIETVKNVTGLAKSRSISPINCGDVKFGTTINETNTVSQYYGADKVYILSLDKRTEIELTLANLNSDLDLFLAEVLQDSYGRKLIGSYLASSTLGGSNSESIHRELDKGEYFIIVETYSSESSFSIGVDCGFSNPGGPNPIDCEDMESYNYWTGITQQSNFWNKWTSSTNDGKVKYENYRLDNKVVKFDAGRFGYQDVVRDIIGLPLNHGWYTMSFDIWVASGHEATFLSEKTERYGQEQGFKIKLNNGFLSVTHKGRQYNAQTRLPQNSWVSVYMSFDITYNTIYVVVDSITIIMEASAQRSSSSNGRKSIEGVNFYTDSSNSKFHIDNVCVEELEPGYDDPTIDSIYGEILDLR